MSTENVTLENEEFMGEKMTDRGGELNGYFNQSSLRKVQERIGVSNGDWKRDYYFKNGSLIFVDAYFESGVQPDGTIVFSETHTTSESMYYFYQGKLIKQIDMDNKKADLSAKEIQALAKKYVSLLLQKRSI